MKRILPALLGGVAVIGLGVLIGPYFVDWNKYKPQIIEQAKSRAGYDVRIDGDISLSILPSPRLKIEGLSVAAPRGNETSLLSVKRADVSVHLFPMISGDISIDTVRIVSPDIKLQILPDGSNSWMSDQLSGDKQPSGGGAEQGGNTGADKSIGLGKLIIEDGRVSYEDRRTGKRQVAEKINMDIEAGTINGPFDIEGSLMYGGKVVEIDAKTEAMAPGKSEMPVDAEISLPEAKSHAAFKGVFSMNPLEIQGKMDINADNLSAVLALGGGEESPIFSRKLAFSGLVTANENTVSSEEVAIEFGDAKGKGSVMVSNLREKDPVLVKADMALEGVLNLDQLPPVKDKNKQESVEERVAKGEKLSAQGGFLPESLTLPFPVDGEIKLTADTVQSAGVTYKGIVADVTKNAGAINIAAKVMDMPGKTTAEGSASVHFMTSSASGEKDVTYVDPSVVFKATGSSEQLPTLLRAFAPAQDANAALEIWKTAQFDLNGEVTQKEISVKDSTLKLDQTSVALTSSYRPNGVGGRPDIMLDVTTDSVDIDYIQGRLSGQKKQVVQKDAAAKADVEVALKPVRDFSMPVNLTFDFSAQNATFNAQQITGIRIKGKAAGQGLTLDAASVQDYMGAAANLKGSVVNLQDLSGIDLSFYGRTDNLKSLMQSLEMDTSKLPEGISEAQANITAKGKADELAFDAKIKAMNGQIEVEGNMTGLLDKPSFSNLSIGAKHPNFVKAIQIVNPDFTGGPGLERPFDFYTKAVKTGDVYDISGFKANLGPTTLNGSLKVNMADAKPEVTGTVDAGDIPLDSLLGAKNGAAKASSSAAAAGSGGGKEKWSRSTIETGWMQSVNLDLGLAAQSITYNGWDFDKPNTKITLKDGALLVDDLNAGLFGGKADVTAKVVDPADEKQPLSLVIQSKMTDVAVEPLMFALSGTNRVKASGDISLDMDVQSLGLSPHALISGLTGKANVNGKNIVMKGFDLAQIGLAFVDTGKPMDRLSSIVTGATAGGETRFDTVVGAYNIAQGIVTINNMAMDGPAANIKSTGNVNLPLWTIDTVHAMTFKQAKDAGTFNVNIKGPLDNPGNTFGKGLFNDVLTRRLQQKAVEKLPDVLGKDLGGKLKELGILPGKQVVAPAQAPTEPAPAADNPSAPASAPQPQAQPVPQQPEQQKPLDQQIKDDPEKAIKGVLDGLLR